MYMTKCKNDVRIMKAIPKELHTAIYSAWVDDDGFWIMLNNGYKVNDYFSERTIHEDSLSELANVAKRISKS